MPPVKNCPYCEYTTSSTHCFNPHVFKSHKDELHAALRAKYSEYNLPIAPFTLTVARSDKKLIICLCCNEMWTSSGPYDKHIVNSKGACVPANQLIALQQATGLKFSEKAKEQTATTSLQKQQAEAIEKLMAIIAKMKEENLERDTKIRNLETTIRITKPWLTASAQNAILPPPPQATPQPPPKPTVKPPLPNQVLSDSDEEEEDDEDKSSSEDLPVIINPKLRCKYAEICKEIGDVNSFTQNDISPCLACKIPVCTTCIRQRGSKTRLHWYCSPDCYAKK